MSFWIAERSFDIDTLIRAPLAEVRSFLDDPQKWVGFQPLILGITEEPSRPGFYRIKERLEVAGVPVKFGYRARIEPHDGGVDSEAWTAPFIHVANRLRWTAEGSSTRLSESSHLDGPRPLMSFVLRTAKTAHIAMLERIRREIEGRERGEPSPAGAARLTQER